MQLITYGRRIPFAELFARIDAVNAATIKRVANRFIFDQVIPLSAHLFTYTTNISSHIIIKKNLKLCNLGTVGHCNCGIWASEAIARLQLVPPQDIHAPLLDSCCFVYFYLSIFTIRAWSIMLFNVRLYGLRNDFVISFQARIKPRLFLYCHCTILLSVYTTKCTVLCISFLWCFC